MPSLDVLWRLMRPYQWSKNIFVFTGLLFGHAWSDLDLVIQVCLIAVAFSLVSSSVYIFNDVQDVESDRKHPKKKKRPIAAGEISVQSSLGISAFLFLFGTMIGYSVSWIVMGLLILYACINVFYSIWLKHIVILDAFCVSAGFMLRILSGTIGIGIAPSHWLLLCSLMMTLFLSFAKRRAESIILEGAQEEHRQVLGAYHPVLLDQVIAICATGVIISYSLYTMSEETIRTHHTENLIYTTPFVIYALFRYIYMLHQRIGGGDPSRDLIRDKHIVLSVCSWILLTLWLFF